MAGVLESSWQKTVDQWKNHRAYAITLMTVAAIGGTYAYTEWTSPGIAGFKRANGGAETTRQSASAFTQLLKKEENGSLKSVAITGHANADLIHIGSSHLELATSLLANGQERYALNDDQGDDVLSVLNEKIMQNGVVYINGCHSQELARRVSVMLPGIKVHGFRRFIAGGNSIGVNEPLAEWSRVVYLNGNLRFKESIWNASTWTFDPEPNL